MRCRRGQCGYNDKVVAFRYHFANRTPIKTANHQHTRTHTHKISSMLQSTQIRLLLRRFHVGQGPCMIKVTVIPSLGVLVHEHIVPVLFRLFSLRQISSGILVRCRHSAIRSLSPGCDVIVSILNRSLGSLPVVLRDPVIGYPWRLVAGHLQRIRSFWYVCRGLWTRCCT